MAGPETPYARGELNLDEAMLAATAPSMAIAGAEQPQATTRGRVDVPATGDPANLGGGQVLDVSMQPAEYGWRPSQEDLGQGRVQNIATPSGPVPVAQMQMPFGAIAARQQAISERRNAVREAEQKAMQAFDPFKGIGDPADPYQTTFNKYITGQYFTKRNEMADAMFSGDVASFDKWVATTPEGRMWMSTNFTRPMDALAKENKGRVETVAKFLVDVSDGKYSLTPERAKALNEYTTLLDDQSAPLPDADAQELLMKGRSAERIISEAMFEKQYMQDADKFAQEVQTFDPKSVVRLPGGRYLLNEKNEKLLGGYRDAKVRQVLSMGMYDGDEKKAREFVDNLVKDTFKVEKFDAWEANQSGSSGSGGGNTPSGALAVPYVRPVTDRNPVGGRASSQEGIFFDVSNKVGDRKAPIKSAEVYDPAKGRNVTMLNPQPGYEYGKAVLRGKMAEEKYMRQVQELEEKKRAMFEESKGETPSQEVLDVAADLDKKINQITSTYFQEKSVPIENTSFLQRELGVASLDEFAAKQYGVTPERIAELVSTPEGMKELVAMTRGEKPKAAATQQKAKAQAVPDAVKSFGVTPERWGTLTPEQQAQVIAEAEKRKAGNRASTAVTAQKAAPVKTAAPKPVAKTPETATTAQKEEAVRAEPPPQKQAATEDLRTRMLDVGSGGNAAETERELSREMAREPIRPSEQQASRDSIRSVESTKRQGDVAAQRQARTEEKAARLGPKFFSGGRMVKGDINGKKVWYIASADGMNILSDYFEDKESAELVLDAFERGEIMEEHISKNSRAVRAAYGAIKK